jgi:uncharacterized protein DUF1569
MKTLDNAADKEEILERLQSIRPDSRRRWGKMSAHQMICHLSDGLRMYMNEKTVAPVAVWYPRAAVQFVALWTPLPWPRGFSTAPEVDQLARGTPPAQFEADLRDLQNLIDRFTRRPQDFEPQLHPHFGRLSNKALMRLGYLHANHHLRQFGA